MSLSAKGRSLGHVAEFSLVHLFGLVAIPGPKVQGLALDSVSYRRSRYVPGCTFDNKEDWIRIYTGAGLRDVDAKKRESAAPS
jgi:hypothetical protein